MADLFTEVDSLRETLRESLEMADKRQEDISRWHQEQKYYVLFLILKFAFTILTEKMFIQVCY